MTLAAVMSALHVSKVEWEDAKFVLFGAGTAGTGLADQIKDAIAVETNKSKEDAGKQIWYFNRRIVWFMVDRQNR